MIVSNLSLCTLLASSIYAAHGFTAGPAAFVGRHQQLKTETSDIKCRTNLEAVRIESDVTRAARMNKFSKEHKPYNRRSSHRREGWLPKDSKVVGKFIERLRAQSLINQAPIVGPVLELDSYVKSNPLLYADAEDMFIQANEQMSSTPLETAPVQDWAEFILLLNCIVTSIAPEYYFDTMDYPSPMGLVGFPINALLDWPMATTPGYNLFKDTGFNLKMKDVLNYWMVFLSTYESTYSLTEDSSAPYSYYYEDAPYLAWLNPAVQWELVEVANAAVQGQPRPSFDLIFQCDPYDPTYGYQSWDEFFIREFVPGVRPVDTSPGILVNACESAPLDVATNVQYQDTFWLKDQPYSLKDMMNGHQLAETFVGGTVYQAFLSALSFHRWNSPVDGRIVDAFNVDGTYYLENFYTGFNDPDGTPDPAAPDESQRMLSAVAARAVIFIEADDPNIGLMCFIGIGMAEVSSCEVTVDKDQHVSRGEQIGTFHFGGSTHCLIFQPGVNLDFIQYVKDMTADPNIHASQNVAVNSKLADVLPRD